MDWGPLMHSHSDTKGLACSPIYPHCHCSILIHGLYHRHYPFIHTQTSHCPPNHFPGKPCQRPSKAFSKSTKAIQSSLFLAKYFSCSWRTMKIASVVLFPAIKPNCMLSIFTTFLTLLSMTLKNLHGMFYQFNSSVRATFQCISLPLVNIHQPTPTPILWNFTIPNHSIA